MKVTVTVDLAEFYSEDETSFKEQIKNDIADRVKNRVWNDFSNLALDNFKTKVDNEFQSGFSVEINSIVSDIIENRLIKKSNYSKELVTLPTYITEEISKKYFNPQDNASSLLSGRLREFQTKFEGELNMSATKIVSELKDRYDLLFASQIVSKLNEAGMLKDDVARLLIPKDKA